MASKLKPADGALWHTQLDLATCLYFVLYRPMFIIIDCYLVLHHKYENKRYVMFKRTQ